MSHLMFSAEDTILTADELAAVPTPAPMGRFHQPVGFGDFLELIKHRMGRAGIGLTQEEFCIDADGQTFFGMMAIEVDGFARDDLDLFIGRPRHDSGLLSVLSVAGLYQ